MKRSFDIVFSLLGLLVISPLLLIISFLVLLDSKGPIFYQGIRSGQNEKPFPLVKFHTTHPNSDKIAITIGDKDPGITKIGHFLRKCQLNELPQLLNVLLGQISFVGPRPDVAKYREEYKKHMPEYYEKKPGITCYSTLYFRDESELYVGITDPEKIYVEYILKN